MGFVDWWKTSSAQASEDYYKLRFDENEINDFRRGLLNAPAGRKFQTRVKKYAKMSGALLGGCLGLMTLSVLPFACLFFASYRAHPSNGLLVFAALIVLFVLAGYTFVGWKLYVLSKDIKTDLQKGRVNAECGNLKIKILPGGKNGNMRIVYSVNDVEFKVLQDAIGDEINKRFLSPIISVADSRTTGEIYRFYYLPVSKLILYYEQI